MAQTLSSQEKQQRISVGFQRLHCEKTVESKCSFNIHMKLHDVQVLTQCRYCGKRFVTVQGLANHNLTYSGDTSKLPFVCSICNKSFSSQSGLTRHSVVHTNETYLKCEECGKEFASRGNLSKHHKAVHTFLRSEPCPICSRTFSSKWNMNIHLTKVHGQGEVPECVKPRKRVPKKREPIDMSQTFNCSYCNRVIYTKSGLEKHEKLHFEEKPYTCPICNNSFRKKENLKSHHMRIHSGQCPFKCPQCPKTFPLKRDIPSHIRRKHTDAKPYACHFCERAFKERGLLRLHLRTHTGEKPYDCPECPAKFSRKASCKLHYKRMHNQMWLDQDEHQEVPVEVIIG